MKNIKILALGLILTTTACVVGPPVENNREKRVEQGLEDAHDRNKENRRYYNDYNRKHDNGRYNDNNDHNDNYDDDYNDPMGNYDQNHDRFYRSNN